MRDANLLRPFLLLLFVIAMPTPTSAFAQREAQLPWWDRALERKIGAYWIKTDLPAEQANALSRHLNLMYAEYVKRSASLPPRTPEKLNVLMFQRERDYRFVLRTRYGVNGMGTGGMFFGTPSGTALAFWVEDLPQRRIEHVLQHEGFHQFAYSRFGSDLPPWVNEGLAEFFGEAVLVGNRLIIGQTTDRVIDAVKNAIEKETYIPFAQMVSMEQQDWNKLVTEGNAVLQYQQSWSMVQFLVYGDNGRYTNAFEQYLKFINAGMFSEDAFLRAFETTNVRAFEERWKEFALKAQPSSFVTAMERIQFLADGALQLQSEKKIPASMDELRSQLREIDFTTMTQEHGVVQTLSSAENDMYVIPEDDLSREPPAFIVEPWDSRGALFRERKANEDNPAPPTIRTENLEPKNLTVRWIRSEDNTAFRYEIEIQ